MISANCFPFCLLLLVLLAENAKSQPKSCDTVGITTNGRQREFQICSEDDNGSLTQKTLACGENSYFSVDEKKCIFNDLNDDQAPRSLTPVLRNALVSPSRRTDLNCPTNIGKYCETCSSIVSCVNKGVVGRADCGEGLSCNPYTKECTKQAVAECESSYSFTCTGMGLFPDPVHCARFYFCQRTNAQPFSYVCSSGYKYDPVKEDCVWDGIIRTANTLCTPLFPECKTDFEVGTLQGNKQLFYVCLASDSQGFTRLLFKNKLDDGTQWGPEY